MKIKTGGLTDKKFSQDGKSYLKEGVTFAASLLSRKDPEKRKGAAEDFEQAHALECKSQQKSAAEDFVQKKSSALQVVSRPDPKYHYLSIGRLDTNLPYQFTHLDLPSTSDTNKSSTPEKKTQKFVATTVQKALITTLSKALDDQSSSSQANIALGVLTIIPYDQSKRPFSIQITRSGDQVNIVYPEDIFGKPQATFTVFQELRSAYARTELDADPIVKSLKKLAREKLTNGELNSAQHQALLKSTHHSEQFILAAISNTLNKMLSSKDPDLKASITKATFLIDISTKLAPCNHCMGAIDDFMNYFRARMKMEDISSQNIFVSRISWLNEYRDSFVSQNSRTSQHYEELVLDDFMQNYFLTCHINKTVLKQLDQVFTRQGENASGSAPLLSSSRDRIFGRASSGTPLNTVYHGTENLPDSPVSSRRESKFNFRFKEIMKDSLTVSPEGIRGTSVLEPDLDESFEHEGAFADLWAPTRDDQADQDVFLSRRSMTDMFDAEAEHEKQKKKSPWSKAGDLVARIKEKHVGTEQDSKSACDQAIEDKTKSKANPSQQGAWGKPGNLAARIKNKQKSREGGLSL
ncbi:hypothetical protein OAP83_02075 [Rickettsiales bacterium]|nr:hypothetical protein [Rickettsiales bacterium]